MKIAYLVSRYPARSHTFIRREVEILRQMGLNVGTYSLRRCGEDELLCDSDRQEYAQTWSVFPLSVAALIVQHLRALISKPGRYFRTILTSIKCRGPGWMGALYALLHFAEGIRLARRLGNDGIDILHIHFGNAGTLVGNCAAEYLGIPWGVTYHGASDFGYPTINMMPWQIRRAAFVRCVSYFGLSQAMRQTTSDNWPKLFVCYSGLPSPDRLLMRETSLRNPGQPLRILVVGRLSPEKGQLGMLEAAGLLQQQGLKFSITFAGDGPDRRMLEQTAAAKKLADHCHFLGSIPEEAVYDLMRNCDVLVCPSLMEGLPQVLMEAMAVGLPVIAPGIAGIPELVEHRVNGMLYPPANWVALAKAIADIACDPTLGASMTVQARKTIDQNFKIDVTITPLSDRLNSHTDVQRKAMSS